MAHAGDLATQVAESLQKEHVAQLEAAEHLLDEGEVMHVAAKRSIFAKIEFSWRTSDAKALDQIRVASDRVFRELFDEGIEAIDRLYEKVRVPACNEYGVVERDASGRAIWEMDSRGQAVEDWGRLTGQDIEETLLDITRLKLIIGPQLDELLLEAVFARHIAEDASADGYTELLDGTVGDRNAHASQISRVDRYHAFFRYYLYRQADTFMRELNNFARVLERIRYWRLEDGSQAPRSHRS